jgi:hypothetical protein
MNNWVYFDNKFRLNIFVYFQKHGILNELSTIINIFQHIECLFYFQENCSIFRASKESFPGGKKKKNFKSIHSKS